MPHKRDSITNLDRLRYLNITQLRNLLEDEETVSFNIRCSKKLQDLQKQNELKWASNCMLAEQNLSYQPYLKIHTLRLAEKYQLLDRLISSLRHKERKLDLLHNRLSLKATRRFLRQKVAHLMGDSEGLWQKFLEGNLQVVDFIESFLSTRAFYYNHLVQVEKIQDLSPEAWRTEMLCTAEPHSSHLQSPDSVNVLYSLSPFVMLPNTLLPLMGRPVKTSYLPPLKHHAGAKLWRPFMLVTSPGETEVKTHGPQRSEHSRYKKSNDRGYRPSL